MDLLIKYFATKQYDNMEKVMKDTNIDISKEDLNGLLNYILSLLKTKMIYDIDAFNGIFIIITHKLSIKDVDDLDFLFKLIYEESLTYKCLKYKNNIHITEKNLEFILLELKQSSGKISTLIGKDVTIDDMDNIINGTIKQIIGSFYDYHFINSLKVSSRNHKQWECTVTNEIENRLINLVNIFGLKLLNFLDIPVVKGEEFIEYSFAKKVDYYLVCINRFIFAVKTIDKVIKNRNKLIIKNGEMGKLHEKTKIGVHITGKASKLYSCMASVSFNLKDLGEIKS